MLHQNNSFHVRGESCEVQSKSLIMRPVWAGDGGDVEGNCPTVQSQHFQPHCRIKEVSTNQIKSPLCSHQAVRFQYIKHILEELYPVYSVHPLLFCSVKTTTNRASITYTYISSVIKLWNLPTWVDFWLLINIKQAEPGVCDPSLMQQAFIWRLISKI